TVVVTTTPGFEFEVFQAELGPVGARVDLNVGGAVGRYVWVLQNSANHLQLAEVVVQGRPDREALAAATRIPARRHWRPRR
ncbi:MAG TPA: hypothetical protein VEW03_01735, partial [Longimicrobiaceae bacterium]|nr:hypothetical protein [Longimicrobiaceae bacterium]